MPETTKITLHREGIRYPERQPTLWMKINMAEGRCWCGKPKKLWNKFQRKYCCTNHADLWFWSIRAYWQQFRLEVINRDSHTCQECGHTSKRDSSFDVDHITAISLGGMCFDLNNVRTVCHKRHNKKTAQDIQKLTLKKKNLCTLEVYV